MTSLNIAEERFPSLYSSNDSVILVSVVYSFLRGTEEQAGIILVNCVIQAHIFFKY